LLKTCGRLSRYSSGFIRDFASNSHKSKMMHSTDFASTTPPQYTASPEADKIVAQHMQIIVQEVLSRVRSALAIVVTGSFGRGEGTFVRDQTGKLTPLND